MKKSIFVSIASFRDPELIPTLDSLFSNADHPEHLHICIGWQHSEDEKNDLDIYKNNQQVTIIDIDYKQSKGACWARSLIQQYYNNEDYYLQIDSHHRFVKGWDSICIQMINELKSKGIKKPLLSAYLPSYNPFNDPNERTKEIWRLDFDRFIPESPFFVLPATATEEELKEPILSRFFSGHFTFVQGSFVKEVPYDPNLFFHGEEGSLAVRAWTSGYDLFIPNKFIAYHEYTREYRKGLKIWDSNQNWVDLNTASHKRHKELFGIDGVQRTIDFGIYDFGTERTLEEYEKFAGIRFKDRSIQQWTLDHKLPPNLEIYNSEEDYNNSFLPIFRHCIDLHKCIFQDISLYSFFAVILKDENDKELYREDLNESQLIGLFYNSSDVLNIWIQTQTKILPKTWIIWPYKKNYGWDQNPIVGTL